MVSLIGEVKKKKEFLGLPDSIVERALNLNKKDVKETRAFLRKYFGVFLTNKVLKGKDEKILTSHISSKKREYEILYSRIKADLNGKSLKSVFDLGCGANGFSYLFLQESFPEISYLGIEASEQIVNSTNLFFSINKLEKNCLCVWEDLFNIEKIKKMFLDLKGPRLVFMFQVLDALENLEKDFGKKYLLLLKEWMNDKDLIVLSYSLKSISGKNKFKSGRFWLSILLKTHFQILSEFELFDEKYYIIKK